MRVGEKEQRKGKKGGGFLPRLSISLFLHPVSDEFPVP